MPAEAARIVLKDFPTGWTSDGRDTLVVSLQAQLEVFGQLKSPPWVSADLATAEAVYQKAEDAKEAIEVLNGVDFREADELLAAAGRPYNGLTVSLKATGKRVAGAGADAGTRAQWMMEEPASKVPRSTAAGPWKNPSSIGLGTPGGTPSAIVGNPSAIGLGTIEEFAGTWSITYGNGANGSEMTYTISETGEVRVGKKRWLQLVLSGSDADPKQDPNYAGTYLLNDAHREDTWEYLWMEGGVMQVHHFSAEDTNMSPRGSPCFWGEGVGVPAGQAQVQPQAWQAPQPGQSKKQKKAMTPFSGGGVAFHSLKAFKGVWTIIYEGSHEGQPYTISASGEVTIGKKRHLQLVAAGSAEDTRCDPNYAIEGVYLLDNAHREDTWEYIWMENGRMLIHHFSSFDTKVSPFGSGNYFGVGIGTIGGDASGWSAKASQGRPAQKAGAWNLQGAYRAAAAPTRAPTRPAGVPTASYWGSLVGGGQSKKKAPASGGYSAGGSMAAWAAAEPVETPAEFLGVWDISYGEDSGSMTYTISEKGEVKIGKKRYSKLVPAGSTWDVKQDVNYVGSFFLNDVHRDDTWEYVWLDDGVMHLHHFSSDDTGLSPLGSGNFFGTGQGTRRP